MVTLKRLRVSGVAVSALIRITPGKECGTENVRARLVRGCAKELVVPLTQLSFAPETYGVFPERWKEANIIII